MDRLEVEITHVDGPIHEKLMQVVLILSMLECWKCLILNTLHKKETKILDTNIYVIPLQPLKTLNPTPPKNKITLNPTKYNFEKAYNPNLLCFLRLKLKA
jgi:hypothetical protein